ncbi:MAG: TetR/AcrR family transcriptional regulator [Deltaproteobacteria bacterium]|nr:TetR/AcrR family transcriptional regulator [Deltaproteobacteria bacterium]
MRRRKSAPRRAPGARAATSGLTIREHILDRTIYLMGKRGTTDVPVRAIAREAGVNVAAVNYYFSSKEQMLAQMAERFTRGFDEVMRLLDAPDLPPEKRLRRWSAEVMRFLAEYPGILALMERQIAAEPADAFGAALRSAMQRAVKQVTATLRELIGGRDALRLAFKLTLFISTLAGPFPRQLERAPARGGARAPAQRARFLDLLLEHLRA